MIWHFIHNAPFMACNTNHPPLNMKKLSLLPVSIKRVMEYCNVEYSIGEDFILTDFDALPMPDDFRFMRCTFVALCLQGRGSYNLGTVERDVHPNDIIIIIEGQVLGGISLSKDFKGIGVFISNEFLYDVISDVHDVTNLFVLAREHPVFTLTLNEVDIFRRYISIMKTKISDTSHLFRKQITSTLLAAMIYDICNAEIRIASTPSADKTKAQEVFELFIRLVERNFRTNRNVGWYSEQLEISPKTLLEMVKRVSNRTPNEWLDVYTSLEIRLLLRHTSKSIKEIADELHFGSQSSLGKFFRANVGMSPSAYRQKK